MKRGNQPILAERVFRVGTKAGEYRLFSTATSHSYEGPVFTNPVPPYTADEWDALAPYRREDWSYGYVWSPHRVIITPLVRDAEEALGLVAVLGGDPRRAGRFIHHPSIHEGVHAFRVGQIPADYLEAAQAVGSVDLFGRVVEYEHGYRAEKMRIKALRLTAPPGETCDPDKVISDLSTRYDCEVTWPTLAAKSKSTKSNWTTTMRRAASNLICYLADRLDDLDAKIDPDE